MADIAIAVGQTASAPQDYLLSGAQEVVLKSLRASYNGAGAATSYFPAIQIISPGGAVVATYTTPSALAAGASADVTWFQGVTGSASGGSASSRQIVEVTATSGQSLPHGANTAINWTSIVYDTSGGVMWAAGSPSLFTAPAAGVYLLSAVIEYTSFGSGPIRLAMNGGGHVVTFAWGDPQDAPGGAIIMQALGITDLPLGGQAQILFENGSSADTLLAGGWAWFTQIG